MSAFEEPGTEIILDDAPLLHGMASVWSSYNRTLKAQLSSAPGDGLAWIAVKSTTQHKYGPWADDPPDEESLKLYPFEVPFAKFSKEKTRLMLNLHDLLLWFYENIDKIIQANEPQWCDQLCGRVMEELCLTIEKHAKGADEKEMETVRKAVSLLRVLEFSDNDNNFSQLFYNWESQNSTELFKTDAELAAIISRVDACLDDEVWDVLYKLLGRGLTDLCGQCLNYISKDKHGYQPARISNELSECIQYAVDLLYAYGDLSGNETAEFNFANWRKACTRAVVTCSNLKEDPIQKHLSVLLKIMSGDIRSIKRATTTWYDTVSCLLRYREASKDRIADYCDSALKIWDIKDSEIEEWEAIAIDLMRGNTLMAVYKMSRSEPAVTAIVAEIAEKAGCFDDDTRTLDVAILEWLFVSHADDCISQLDFELAKSTYDLCYLKMRQLYQQMVYYQENESADVSEPLAAQIEPYIHKLKRLMGNSLTFVPIASKEALKWGLDYTAKLSLNKGSIPYLLLQRYATSEISRNNYIDALMALDSAEAYQRIDSICWTMFEKLLLSLELVNDQAIGRIIKQPPSGFSEKLKQSLSPFAVLYNAIKALRTNRRQAVVLITQLLVSPQLKPQYAPLLVAVAIPLFDYREGLGLLLTESEITLFISVVDDWQHSVPKQIVHQGNALLEYSLSRRNNNVSLTTTSAVDWRRYFRPTDTAERVLSEARGLLAKALSEALLGRM